MFAVFNRFNPSSEEVARDLGATPWQGFSHAVLPPDRAVHSSSLSGFGEGSRRGPPSYALATAISFVAIRLALGLAALLNRREVGVARL